MKRILVVECLHADPQLYTAASDSMRQEGRAMLSAIASDLTEWPDAEVVAVHVPDASENFAESDSGVIWQSCVSVELFLKESIGSGQSFDVAFCIAPEEDRLLQNAVTVLRRFVSRVICVRDELIALGSDKRAFCDWCVSQQIPTLPVLDASCWKSWPVAEGDEVIEKSRFGVGCEGITRHSWNTETQSFVQQADSTKTIWQPFFAGLFYSVGVIGTGVGTDPIVLPVAEQHFEWRDSRPEYLGGRMPCGDQILEDRELRGLVQRLVAALEIRDGYVGLDLLYCAEDSGNRWRVVEMNPRLCTSYIGYRQLFRENLAAFWWNGGTRKPEIPAGKVVKFRVSGA